MEHRAPVPVHRRRIDLEVFEASDERFEVVATLRDERPWAEGTETVSRVHDMSLVVEVDRATLTITAATAAMGTFPHAECPEIEPAFAGLVGLSITRGYTRAVQERFGRAKGCTHLEFLARALGPAVMQALPSSALRHPPEERDARLAASGLRWLGDTCHVWREGGPGQLKLEAGWRPGEGGYPAPSAVELRARREVGGPTPSCDG